MARKQEQFLSEDDLIAIREESLPSLITNTWSVEEKVRHAFAVGVAVAAWRHGHPEVMQALLKAAPKVH